MKPVKAVVVAGALCLTAYSTNVMGQDVSAKNAATWELTGRAQLQYEYNADIDSDSDETNNGFRIRRGRLQAKAKLTDWVSTQLQIDVRDNSPSLKDAEGKIKLGDNLFVRLGQFKVPVWREELRSSGKLLLVERSEVATFLTDMNLSARHIGFELGAGYDSGISWAANISNGSGEGGREDAGRNKDEFVNNGKMLAGRVNIPVAKSLEVGVSAVVNQQEKAVSADNSSASLYAIAPDFGVYTKLGANSLEIEGGFVFGSVSGDVYAPGADDVKFTMFDITGVIKMARGEPNASFGGYDGLEFAGGISYIEPNTDLTDDEALILRGGPAFCFGKNTRFQANAELEMPTAEGADSVFRIRVQSTFDF